MYSKIAIILLLLMMIGVAGCLSPWGSRRKPIATGDPSINLTNKEMLTKVVFQTNWLATASMIGICLGVAAFVNGQKIALPVIIACGVGLFLSLAVARYASVLAFGGLVMAGGVLFWTLFSKNKAIQQLVQTVDVVREKLPTEADQELFGNENCVVKGKIQSEATSKLVKKIKNRLNVKKERTEDG